MLRKYVGFILVLLFLFQFLKYNSACSDKNDEISIELILPESRSPLFYNGDTMFIKANFLSPNLLNEIVNDIRNSKDSSVYFKKYQPNQLSYCLTDTFVFKVKDHSNFIMSLKAKDANHNEKKLDVYIHVMP